MPSAEELFPIFIYMLIGANPGHISLNLDYIDKFIRPSRRISREGYLLTSLSTALNFLEHIDSSELLKGRLAMSTD